MNGHGVNFLGVAIVLLKLYFELLLVILNVPPIVCIVT